MTFTTYKTLRAGRGGVILCKQKYADRINRAIFPGGQGTPSLNLIAAKAVCFHLAQAEGFVELQKSLISGAVSLHDIPEHSFRIDEENHRIIDRNSKVIYQIGDIVQVILLSVDKQRWRINFALHSNS